MERIFFNGWESVIRLLVTAFMAYLAILILLRVSGMI